MFISGIDFKIKTVELDGKKIKLQIWWVWVILTFIDNNNKLYYFINMDKYISIWDNWSDIGTLTVIKANIVSVL